MPSERPAQRLRDIIENIERIERITAELDLGEFRAHVSAPYAVQYTLLIISEAARKLGGYVEAVAPTQPWASIRSLGNVLRHQYDDVDSAIIWRIVKEDLPSLKQAATAALLLVVDQADPDAEE